MYLFFIIVISHNFWFLILKAKDGIADWAMGEALAYGSLLRDKIHIRLTGEDVERGTMAHR